MKKKLLILCAVLSVCAVIAVGTAAYFTAEDTARNVITAGNIDLEIHETAENGAPFPADGMEIMPGDTVTKVVTVENTSEHPLYLRVAVTKGVEGDDTLSAEDCLEPDVNTTDWTLKDGYYYYNTALNPGETTQPLFTQVTFDGFAIDNDYLGKTFTLDVDAYGVQAENNGETVFDAAGWPEKEG